MTVDLADPNLPKLLERWQDYYNSERPHGSIGNCTPQEKWHDLCLKIPFSDEIWEEYDPKNDTSPKIQHGLSDQRAKPEKINVFCESGFLCFFLFPTKERRVFYVKFD